jgi:hypothetical protein
MEILYMSGLRKGVSGLHLSPFREAGPLTYVSKEFILTARKQR